MAQLKEKLEQHGIPLGAELPDFLPHLLRLLAHLDSQSEEAGELHHYCLLPAFTKISEEIKNRENPYSSLLFATKDFLACKETNI